MKQVYRKWWRIGLRIFLVIFGLLTIFILSIYAGAWGKLPSKKDLSTIEFDRASEVYSADSVLIGKYYLYDRQPISNDAIPDHLIEALVAIEDRRFYDHQGIDYRSLFRVGFKTILLGDSSSGGGSTLSQQLAKNLNPRERTGTLYLVVDKIKEMITARRLEKIYNKEELLGHYLNTVSFGDNTFGVESASNRFFGKRAIDLNIEEGAVLMGMLKATYSYNPRLFPEKSLDRRNTVLKAMEETEHLTESESDSLQSLPLILNYTNFDHDEGIAPYFREEVRKIMEIWCENHQTEGKPINLYSSGLKIYTTLDYEMQLLAEEAMKEHMSALQKAFERSYGKNAPWITNKKLIDKVLRSSQAYKEWIKKGLSDEMAWDSIQKKKELTLVDWNGPITSQYSSADSIVHYMKFLNTGSLSIDPFNGAVKTWIGGIDFEHFKYDHISQSRRQLGSSFKPIVYTAALEAGFKACDHFSAQEVLYKDLEDWSPGNSSEEDETYLNYSMEEALSNSVNTVSVKVLEQTGISNVINMAQKMGIDEPLPKLPSLALGTGAVGIEELAGAYASYLNQGRPVKPYLIKAIQDSEGNTLESFNSGEMRPPAFSEESRLIMLEMLKSVVEKGTASRIRHTYGLKNDIAGKTGTTQNNKDAWFVAVTPKLVHVSWVGLDHHEIGFKDTSLGQGANAALPLFANWMQKLNANPEFNSITMARFEQPEEEILRQLDCDPVIRDNFFKRLFKNPKRKKSRKFKKQKGR